MKVFAAFLALTSLTAAGAMAQTASELTSGAGNNVATTPPTQGPVTFTFRNNSNNPGGTTFANIASPAPQVTFSVVNQQYANATNFTTRGAMIGGTVAGDPHFPAMNFLGGAANGNYTSLPVNAAGTGIAINTNRGILMELKTLGLSGAGVAANGRYHIADLVIDFSHPVSNPVLHFVGLGGNATKTFSAEFDLLTADSIGATGLARLSGNGVFAVSGTQINHSSAAPGGNCNTTPNGACGSVHVTGDSVSRIVLRAYLEGADGVAWPTNGTEGIILSLSGEFSDLVPTLGAIPAVIQPGETYYGLTNTCVNNGPNTARGALCTPAWTVGTIANLTCTSIVAGALTPGATASCSYDYTAPPSGSGEPSVTFTGTSGALNDRNGGIATAGNNETAEVVRILDDAPFQPSEPAGICSAVADRMAFSYSAVVGGNEAGSYDLVSRSPFSYDANGKPVFMTGSGTVQTQTVGVTPGASFKHTELTTAALRTIAGNGTGELAIISTRVIGKPGSVMTVLAGDTGGVEHDVATIETDGGTLLARSPSSGSDSADGTPGLTFTMPPEGFVFLRQYVVDYGSTYGARTDGGCLRADIRTVKVLSSAQPTVAVGDPVAFTITVTNNGPSDASNVDLFDLIGPEFALASAVPGAGSYDPPTGRWLIGPLANGASETLVLNVAPTAIAANQVATNTTAAATADQEDPVTAGNVLSASVTVLEAANVVLQKVASLHSNADTDCGIIPGTPDPAAEAFIPGSCVQYVITLQNTSGVDAMDVFLTDVMPDQFIFAGASLSGIDGSAPGYAFQVPSGGTSCLGNACQISIENGIVPASSTATLTVRAVMQ